MNNARINGRYQLLDTLGSGGMGTVYRAHDRLTDQQVALKWLDYQPGDLSVSQISIDGESDDPAIALVREFRTLATLRHPNVITVRDFGFHEDGGKPFYTMDILENARSVTEVAAERDLTGRVQILMEILQALIYLHRQGILHRDLKPGNVLVDANGQVKVLDFGVAIREEQTQGLAGTLHYMAPEIIEGESATPASDLYSVGVMGFEFFAGKHPFDITAPTFIHAILNDTPNIEEIDAPPNIQAVIMWLLMKRPSNRYASAQHAIAALYDAMEMPVPPEKRLVQESFLRAAQFVGRKSEHQQLAAALTATMAGSGSTWLVAGESGVGKSRLIDEVRIRGLVHGFQVFGSQAVENGGVPYRLIRDVMMPVILQTTITLKEAQILKPIIPEIDRLIDQRVPDPPAYEEGAYSQQLAQIASQIIARQTKPTLLIFEDLQWVQESLAIIRQFHPLTTQMPLMIIGSYRSDEAPYFYGKLSAGAQVITLDRLSRDDIAELSASMLGNVGRKTEIVNLLDANTEGNVFFMIDMIQMMAEDVSALADIGRVTLPRSILSRGMGNAVARRLKRLPAEYQPILRLTAVMGREIDFALLEHLNLDMDYTDWLSLCADASILNISDGVWHFAHDKIREGLLQTIDVEERKRLHSQAAAALEAVYGDDPRYHLRLVDHLYYAGSLEQMLRYLPAVVTRQIEVTAEFELARELIERALELLTLDDPRRVALWNLYAPANWRQGRYDDAERSARAALDGALKANDTDQIVLALTHLGIIERYRGRLEHAERYTREGIRKVIDPHSPQRGKLLNNLGNLLRLQGRYAEAESALKAALDISVQQKQNLAIGMRMASLGHLALEREDWAAAQRYIEDSIAIFEEEQTVLFRAYALNNLGECFFGKRQYIEAVQVFEQSMLIKRQISDADRSLAGTLGALGCALIMTDQLEAAHRRLIDSLRLAYAADLVDTMLQAVIGLAAFDWRSGNLEDAIDMIALVYQHHQKTPTIERRLRQMAVHLPAKKDTAELKPLLAANLETLVKDILVAGTDPPQSLSARR